MAVAILDTEHLRYWFVFLALGGFTQVAEFGMLSTFVRFFSYSIKAKKIGRKNRIKITKDAIEILGNSKYIYLYVTLIATVAMVFFGSIYLRVWLNASIDVISEWLIYSLSMLIYLYANRYVGLINGANLNEYTNVIIILSKSVSITVSILLMRNYSLLGIAIGNLMGSIVFILLAYTLHRSLIGSQRIEKCFNKVYLHKTAQMGLTQLGAFILQRGITLIVAASYSSVISVAFSTTLSVLQVIATVSTAYMNSKIRDINKLMISNNLGAAKKTVFKSYLFGVFSFGISLVILIVFGEIFLSAIGKNDNILSGVSFYLMVAMIFLEMIHSIAAGFIAASNQLPFYKSSLLTAAVVLVGGVVVANYFNIASFIFFIFLVQLSYNNWKWPLYLYEKYNWHR